METPNTPAGKLTEAIMAALTEARILSPCMGPGTTASYNRAYSVVLGTMEKQLAPKLPLLSPEGHAMFDRAITNFRAKQKYSHGSVTPVPPKPVPLQPKAEDIATAVLEWIGKRSPNIALNLGTQEYSLIEAIQAALLPEV